MTWASTPHSHASFNDAIQKRLDAHLDKIEKVLTRDGATREERRAITDELETQIRDMLAAEVNGGELKLSHLEAVLKKLDPPEAYRKPAPSYGHPLIDKAAERVWPMNAGWALGFCAVGWAVVLLGIVLPGPANTGGAVAFNLAGIVFGLLYRKEELGRQGLLACGVSAFLLIFAG